MFYNTVSKLWCVNNIHRKCLVLAWYVATCNTRGGIVAWEGHESHLSLAAAVLPWDIMYFQ